MSTIRSGDRQGTAREGEGEKVEEKDERRKSFVSGVQVFVFSPVAGTSHESHWEKHVDNKHVYKKDVYKKDVDESDVEEFSLLI